MDISEVENLIKMLNCLNDNVYELEDYIKNSENFDEHTAVIEHISAESVSFVLRKAIKTIQQMGELLWQ